MTSQELETFLKNQDSEIKHLITVKTQSQEARLLAIEQKLVARGGGPASDYAENIGDLAHQFCLFNSVSLALFQVHFLERHRGRVVSTHAMHAAARRCGR